MKRTDQEWVADLAAGGERQREALEELRRRLLAGLRRALQGQTDAGGALLEDCVQDALMTVLARLDTFRGDSRFLTWAMTIAVHGAWAELRRRRWRDVSLEDVLAEREIASHPEDGGAQGRVERSALVASLFELIEADLTERQRTALLAMLRGMPQEEIARHLESNRNAVYKLIHDARRRLKEGLEKAGYSSADVSAAFGR